CSRFGASDSARGRAAGMVVGLPLAGSRHCSFVVLVILLELALSRAGISEPAAAWSTTKPASISIYAAAVTPIPAVLATEAAVSTTTSTAKPTRHAHPALSTCVLGTRGAGFLALGADAVDVAEEFGQLLGAVPHIDALVFA